MCVTICKKEIVLMQNRLIMAESSIVWHTSIAWLNIIVAEN